MIRRAQHLRAERSEAGALRSEGLVWMIRSDMQARRHPGAVLALWGWQATLALLVSGPAAATVGAAYGAHPQGDAPLWRPGGYALIEFLFGNASGIVAVAREAEIVVIFSAVAGLVPMAAAMFAIAHARRTRRRAGFARCVARALSAFPRLTTLLGLVGLAQALALAVGLGAVTFCEKSMHALAGEALAQQVKVAAGLGFLFVVSVCGVVQDLARAAVVRFGVGAIRALAIGMSAFRLAPTALWWAWGWRAFASLAPVVIAAGVTTEPQVGSGALILVVLVHQAVVAARVALHASWLAKALRSVDGAPSSALYRTDSDR